MIGVTFALVLAIGVVDFLTGFEFSWLTFYLLPVCLAVVAFGWRLGVLTAVVSVATWVAGDVAAGAHYGNPFLPVWNALIALGAYLVVVALFSSLLAVQREMEDRVRQRTAALTAEIAERSRLEREILEIGEKERRRIGHDLHDGLGQHLTATAIAAQVLAEDLASQGVAASAEAGRLVALVENAIDQTRGLAKGLLLADIGEDQLAAALQELATGTALQYRLECEFHGEAIPLGDAAVASHLYRIAQEAVRNAVRHGKARRIEIALTAPAGGVRLAITDDGVGLPPEPVRGPGLGLRIMAHRAGIIGARFATESPATGGTRVVCELPVVDRTS